MDRWLGTVTADFLIRQWDNDTLSVLYDPRSGDTHLLDPLSLELLDLIGAGARTVQALAAELDGAFAAQEAGQACAMIERSLAQLQDMGLARRQPPIEDF